MIHRTIWIIIVIIFASFGPILIYLQIPGISKYDPENQTHAIFWAQLHIYLWPTKLMAWGGGLWNAISVIANYLVYLLAAFVTFYTYQKKNYRLILISIVLVWAFFLGLFLAGFNISQFHLTSFLVGLAYYALFILIIDRLFKMRNA